MEMWALQGSFGGGGGHFIGFRIHGFQGLRLGTIGFRGVEVL